MCFDPVIVLQGFPSSFINGPKISRNQDVLGCTKTVHCVSCIEILLSLLVHKSHMLGKYSYTFFMHRKEKIQIQNI